MVPFLVFVVVILCVFLFVQFKKENSGSWIQFFSKGKEAGFNLKDLEQLKQLVITCEIRDPVEIFKSQKQFEKIIRSMVNAIRLSGETDDPATQIFLSKLFDYFKKIEMQVSENKTRISNSHQIKEGQNLRILVAGIGVFKSEVVKNVGNYLTISRPANSKTASSMQWYGQKISGYFWREDDAGYVFDSEVVDEVFSKGISSLKIEHNNSLFRTQKRKSVRLKFCHAAFLYIVNNSENPHKLEKTAGLRCMLEDISDTGCAFKVLGQAAAGLRLKVQFSLVRVPVCIPGTVRAVEYNQAANTSIIRMEADPLPIATRNHILSEVFNMMSEDDEDELPFRVLEEEIANAASRQASADSSNKFQEVMNA